MIEAEVQTFIDGPVPVPRCRDVPQANLRPGECDEQTEYGTSAGPRYCGAPKAQGFRLCHHHLFTALNSDEPIDDLRG